MVFLKIFFVYFRLENEVQLLKEKIKTKEECGVWITYDGEEDILCCCFFLFLSTYMFTFLFDKLNFSVHFQVYLVFSMNIREYLL